MICIINHFNGQITKTFCYYIVYLLGIYQLHNDQIQYILTCNNFNNWGLKAPENLIGKIVTHRQYGLLNQVKNTFPLIGRLCIDQPDQWEGKHFCNS